jgi:hypothetical protein
MSRPEITGRKIRRGAKKRPRGPAIRAPPPPRGAYSVDEFCNAHGFRVTLYYELKKKGLAPVEMRVGRRVLISFEAAEAWRRAREAAATNIIAAASSRATAVEASV